MEKLLTSRVHEERLVALIILVARFRQEPERCFASIASGWLA